MRGFLLSVSIVFVTSCLGAIEFEVPIALSNTSSIEKKLESLLEAETKQTEAETKLIEIQTKQIESSPDDLCKTVAPRDCSDVKKMGYTFSGVYRICPYSTDNAVQLMVFCDFDTPGGDWLVFQRRKDGSIDFYRNWKSYSDGFGNLQGEFWLGNDLLHQLISRRKYKMRVDLEDFEHVKKFAEYSAISIGPLSDNYRLKLGAYTGDAGDSFATHNNDSVFSTWDAEHSFDHHGPCATTYQGAWWYGRDGNCHQSNLNGRYLRGSHSTFADGIEWSRWHGFHYSLKATEMKISL